MNKTWIALSAAALLFALAGCSKSDDEGGRAGPAEAMPAAVDSEQIDKAVSVDDGALVEDLVAQAVTPLPEALQAGASVYRYDADGKRVVLREGSNYIECMPKDDRGFTLCFPKNTAARRDYQQRLTVKGLEGDELRAAMQAGEEAGEVDPAPMGSILYRAYDNDDRIELLWVVLLPNATAEDLGMPTASQRDPSLAGFGRPWMMREGTPRAHLMIPINGTALSNAGGQKPLDTGAITDPIEHATLPLPAELRDGATVVTYDADGNRQVLREGTNVIECTTRNEATGFTRCYPKYMAAEADLRAKLSAEGKDFREISAAMNEARAHGDIPAARFGSLYYRLYEGDDRLKLLWVLRLPNAMPEDLGMSTASQRDASLAGEGLPWMMREGTPSAHLMIPINSTELSNPK